MNYVMQFLKMFDPSCWKLRYTQEELQNIKASCVVYNSTTLYTIYRVYVEKPMPYKDFYPILKKYFYYDKYICRHGIEFLYYVKFVNADFNTSDRLPTDVIDIVKAHV